MRLYPTRSPAAAFVSLGLCSCLFAFVVLTAAPLARAQSLTSSDPGSNRQLTPAASMLEQAFPTNQASDNTDVTQSKIVSTLTPIKGAVITTTFNLMRQAATAFSAQNPAFQMDFLFATTNQAAKDAFTSGGYDYAVVALSPSAADLAAMPGLQHYPLQAIGVVPTYNLPASVTNGATMSFSGVTLCRIFRANITRWTDPAIVNENPDMNWAAATGRTITVMLIASGTGTHASFTAYCNKIDPGFKIPPSTTPAYPLSSYAAYQTYPSIDTMNSAVQDTSFSIAMTTLANAKTIDLSVANMINAQGTVLSCTTNSMSLNLFELATNGYAPGTNSYDLTNPQTPQAWPLMSMTYLYLNPSLTLTTCASKKLLLEFFLWYYGSSVVSSIAVGLNLVVFPSIFVDQLQILQRLRSEVLCQDSMLVSSSGHSSFVGINALAAPLVTLYSSFYLAVDSSRTYTISSASESLMMQRLIAGELGVALINMQQMSDKDTQLMTVGTAVPIPAFMSGIVPIFQLPLEITTLYAKAASTKALGLPALYPLVVTLDVMTCLFLGEIGSWLDPLLTDLNPQLIKWFQATAADPTLRLVVGASKQSDPLKGALTLFQVMKSSAVSKRPENAQFFPTDGWVSADGTIVTNPFLAVAASAATIANVTIIDVESRLTLKSSMTPGSVSYRMIGSASTSTGQVTTDPTAEFQMQVTNSMGVVEIVQPTAAALKSCAVVYSSMDGTQASISNPLSGVDVKLMDAKVDQMLDVNVQRNWVNPANPQPGCWPVSSLLSFAVPLTFTSAVSVSSSSGSVSTSTAIANTCDEGTNALEFIHFIQSTPLLTAAAESFGLIRLSESSLVRRLSEQVLYSSTCDGTALLVIEPFYYSIPTAVSGFGQAVSIIGMIIALVSAAVVFTFRQQVVIRSASAPFLLFILCGVGLLFGAIISWSVEPSPESCAAFSWLANLGFMMLFGPLFLKTWRVWRIFSGAHLKVVKLSNNKLMAIMAAAVLADIVLLSAWQGVSPMTPIQYSKQIGGNYHYYTHCSVNPKGMPFVILEGIFKCSLLLFGSVMAFSTRNVKGTFNEATQIAWSIYNTLATGLITVVIIVFIAAVETTLIVLVQIFILWLALCTWALLFIPKFHLLFQSEEAVIEASRSDLPQEKSAGFSFASVAVMSAIQLKQYYGALKVQMNKVEARLGYKVTAFPSGPGETAPPTTSTGTYTGKGARYSRTGNSSHGGGETTAESDPLSPDTDMIREQSLIGLPPRPVRNISTGVPSTTSRNYHTLSSGILSPSPRVPPQHALRQQGSSSIVYAAAVPSVLPNTVEEGADASTAATRNVTIRRFVPDSKSPPSAPTSPISTEFQLSQIEAGPTAAPLVAVSSDLTNSPGSTLNQPIPSAYPNRSPSPEFSLRKHVMTTAAAASSSRVAVTASPATNSNN